VAGVAAAAGQIARARGVVAERRDHLQELAADRHDDVLEPEMGDARIAEADLQVEHLAQLSADRLELPGDEGDLAQAHGRRSFAIPPCPAPRFRPAPRRYAGPGAAGGGGCWRGSSNSSP